jgi:hypothetical protein
MKTFSTQPEVATSHHATMGTISPTAARIQYLRWLMGPRIDQIPGR